MTTLRPGDRVAGRFLVEGTIGAGGMGVVLRARDERLGRTVALKVLSARAVGDARARARLLREAQATAVLDHPNIIHVHDVGETPSGDSYIVLELVKGRSLAALLEGGPLPVREVARIVSDAARALSYAHERGFVHRDIKPDNLMVRDDGRVVVLDFGLVKPARREARAAGAPPSAGGIQITQMGAIVGTPAYMAPEQVMDDHVDGRVDQFALAVTAYRAMTGLLPWKGKTAEELIDQILDKAPDRPSTVGFGAVPPSVDAVLLRALEKDPRRRYPTPTAFADALLACLPDAPREASEPQLHAQRPADLAPTQTEVRPSPWRSPRRWWAVVIGALAVLAASSVALGILARRSRSAQAAPALSAPDAKLACPQLVTDDPDGAWLGAAAASLVCVRIGDLLGAAQDRVLVPAELLDLPPNPTSGFPAAPFDEPGARDRALSRATTRGAVWLDGRVTTTSDAARVETILRDPGGRELARGSGTGPSLQDAVQAAVDALAATGVVPVPRELPRERAAWVGTTSPHALVAFRDLDDDQANGRFARRDRACASLAGAHPFAELAPLAAIECALFGEDAATSIPVDRTSPGALALTARYHVVSGGEEDPSSLARELSEARAKATTAAARARLAQAEAEMWQTARDGERARDLAVLAVALDPKLDLAWARLASIAVDSNSTEPVARAFSAWFPGDAVAWRWRAMGYDGSPGDRPERIRMARRGYLLAPGRPVQATTLGTLLLASGEREEALAIAARLSAADSVEEREAGAALAVAVLVSQAHFRAAYGKAREALLASPKLGTSSVHVQLIERGLALASLLGEGTRLADELAARFVLGEPALGRFFSTPTIVLAVCTAASASVATPCLAQLRSLLSRSHFRSLLPSFPALLEGATRYVRGDLRGAAESFRGVARERGIATQLLRPAMAAAFEAAADDEARGRVEADALAEAAAWNGATPAHARAARLAIRRRDVPRARALARQVVDAWAGADERLRVVDELRPLTTDSQKR